MSSGSSFFPTRGTMQGGSDFGAGRRLLLLDCLDIRIDLLAAHERRWGVKGNNGFWAGAVRARRRRVRRQCRERGDSVDGELGVVLPARQEKQTTTRTTRASLFGSTACGGSGYLSPGGMTLSARRPSRYAAATSRGSQGGVEFLIDLGAATIGFGAGGLWVWPIGPS